MAWVYLIIAGLLEIVWATAMKLSEGFSRPAVSAAMVGTMILSFVFLALAMRTLPLGVSYTVWTGIGAVGSVFMGIALFGEARDPLKLLCVALIVVGTLGLRTLAER
jgi:quaternary ammonium compound-resistance protein SugE